MTEFLVESWDGLVEQRVVNINPQEVEKWGDPIETVWAVLSAARWGAPQRDAHPDYRRRADLITTMGDNGVWEGTMGGRHFLMRNLAFGNAKGYRQEGGSYTSRLSGLTAPRVIQGVQQFQWVVQPEIQGHNILGDGVALQNIAHPAAGDLNEVNVLEGLDDLIAVQEDEA